MRREPYPDVFAIWGLTWTKQGQVGVGPAITAPEDPLLALAVAYQRTIRQGGRDVLVDPTWAMTRSTRRRTRHELAQPHCVGRHHRHPGDPDESRARLGRAGHQEDSGPHGRGRPGGP